MTRPMSAIKNQIELSFRTIRLGTLRTFPVKLKHEPVKTSAIKDVKEFEPLLLSEKGIRFVLTLEQDGAVEIVVKISAKRILCVHAYMSRGCPVLWIKPDKVCAERIRNLCNIHTGRGPYLDPHSEAQAEQEIAVITSQDPLPFAVGHSIQRIFHAIAKRRGLKPEKFFVQILHKENNDKLVQCTVYMDNVEHQRHGPQPITESRKHPHSKQKNSQKRIESDSESDFSDYDIDGSGELSDGDRAFTLKSKSKEGANDKDFRAKIKSADVSARSVEPRKASKKTTTSDREKESDSQSEKRKEPQFEKKKDLLEKKKDCQIEKTFPPAAPTLSVSPPDQQRKVHRARKSIPNRHRAVSIESQLRARIEEQTPKEIIIKKDIEPLQVVSSKRKHSDESDNNSDLSRPSGSESIDSVNSKKKRTNSALWMGKKKKKKAGNSSGSASPVPDLFENSIQQSILRPSASTSAELSTSRMSKTMDRKCQAVTMQMKATRQDADTYLQLTPLCTCVVKSPHTINLSGSDNTKCMAMDHVDGRLFGCFNNIHQPDMFRPSNRVPVLGLCDEHRERMVRHECCPGCGTFCIGGTFLVCVKNKECPHRFHRDCMILLGRHGDCPHCGSDLTDVKEINLKPGHDEDLMWILAGHNPEKVRTKQYVENRGRSARMGHKPAVQLVPERLPGITEKLPGGVTINLTTLIPGVERDELEELLLKLQSEPPNKNKFQAKQFLQHVTQGDLTKVIEMLSDGFDENIHKPTLDTALLEAIPNTSLSIIHLLLQAGADVNVAYENGETPLFRAMYARNKKLLCYLLVNGADVKVMGEEGMTCLHCAAKDGYIGGCYLLLAYGKANINALSDGGYTPIMWAAEHKQATMAKYLLHHAADLSRVDNEGNICLQWAALSGNVDIILLCLQQSSDPNHCNVHGDTALHIAAREDHHNCISLLLSYGADPTIRNHEGDTALQCAPEGNSSWIMLKINKCIREAGLVNKKHLPLNRERVLCDDMSRGYDKVPVVCVNSVDTAACPTDPPNGFHYVTENVHTSNDTRINYMVAAIQSCRCSDGCKTATCNCGIISEGCWYSESGTLLPNFDILEPPLIFECHKMCKCSKSCSNRVVQNGIKYRLQVYRTVGMGWGLRALEPIPRGAFVCDYVGELITDAEADIREDDSYLFDLENKDGEMYCIDARNYGNVSRFINHLCEPNLVPIRVFVDHHDIRFPKLAYFTTRDIKPYDELGFDYGDRFWDVKCRQFTCQCGSQNCKYSAEAYAKKAMLNAEEQNKVDMETSAANNGLEDEQ